MSTPLTQIDFYKADHRSQYPEGTTTVFSNWTPRKSRIDDIDEVVFFGLQYFVKEYLINRWNRDFFDRPKDEVVQRYARRMRNAGITIEVDHIEALHDLGYLPLEIMALPEGSAVPLGMPMFIMWNTNPEFFWITNYFRPALCRSCRTPGTTGRYGPSTYPSCETKFSPETARSRSVLTAVTR